MVARTRLDITLYEHCLSCVHFVSVFCVFKLVRGTVAYLSVRRNICFRLYMHWVRDIKELQGILKNYAASKFALIRLLAPSHHLTRLCRDNGTTTRKMWVMKSHKSSRIIVDILNKCSELFMKLLRKRAKYHHGFWTGCLTEIFKFFLRCCLLYWSICLHYYRKLLIHGQ